MNLQRDLYGLRQAPHLWYEKWLYVASKMVFTRFGSDECVFYREGTLVLRYVDDISRMSRSKDEVARMKRDLGEHLDMRDMGRLHFLRRGLFLRGADGACLSQNHYVEHLLNRSGTSSWEPVGTSIREGSLRVHAENESPPADKALLQELPGSLLFLSMQTQPDIRYVVYLLARYTFAPTQQPWTGLKGMLRYPRGTSSFALWIGSESDFTVVSYSDADWVGDHVDRNSTTVALIQIGGNSVVYKTQKQSFVVLSSTEAEYIAFSEAYETGHMDPNHCR